MRDIHVTRDLLAAVAAGTLPVERLVSEVLHHLEQQCEPCRREISAALSHQPAASDLINALVVMTTRLEREVPEAEAREAEVSEWLRELHRVQPADRPVRVSRARKRFYGSLFAQEALRACQAALPSAPEESLSWARVAAEALSKHKLSSSEVPILARALAWASNAKRAVGDLREAESGFQAVHFLIQVGGVTDTLALAEADTLEASLCRDQRRFDEAENLLRRAIDLYLSLGESVEAEVTRLKLAGVASLTGRHKLAVDSVWKTLRVLSPHDHPRLHLMARFKLAHYLHDAGRQTEALSILVFDEDVYDDHGNATLLLHRRWLEAKIAFAMGDSELAEPLFRRVRTAFLRRKMALDVAAVSIDLALLLLKAGRLGEVKQVAREAITLFEAQGIHREALAALLLFEEAAREEKLTAAFLTRLASYLPQAAADPEYRFER